MSTARLTFLYPHLLRAAGRPNAARKGCKAVAGSRCILGDGSEKRWKGTFAPRHGKAIEPTSLTKKQQQERQQKQQQQQQQEEKEQQREGREIEEETTQDTAPTPVEQLQVEPEQPELQVEVPDQQAETEKSIVKAQESDEPTAPSSASVSKAGDQGTEDELGHDQSPTDVASETFTPQSTSSDDADPTPQAATEPSLSPEAAKPGGPLDAILHMPPPADHEGEKRQQPSMSPPRYVHHFDSYSLVKQLQEGGYSPIQAITFMKGIRNLLAQNLDVAQESLVSKSDVENELYLFRAACSELGAEIKNNRRLQDEQMRQQRTQLQHEVDNVTQTLNQELLTLNDTVRGIFDDRKMAVNEEQKSVDSAIQQINYKISILLSSDCKSEIEAVRWVLIRRSVVGIIFMAMLTLVTLRYATYLGQERQRETDRQKAREEELRRDGGKTDHSSAADAAVLLAEGGG